MLEVRFTGYKYNLGHLYLDHIKCLRKEKFEDMNTSIEFSRHIINLIKKRQNNYGYSKEDYSFFDKHNIDVVTEFIGLFEVEIFERELHIRSFL